MSSCWTVLKQLCFFGVSAQCCSAAGVAAVKDERQQVEEQEVMVYSVVRQLYLSRCTTVSFFCWGAFNQFNYILEMNMFFSALFCLAKSPFFPGKSSNDLSLNLWAERWWEPRVPLTGFMVILFVVFLRFRISFLMFCDRCVPLCHQFILSEFAKVNFCFLLLWWFMKTTLRLVEINERSCDGEPPKTSSDIVQKPNTTSI